MTFLIVLMLLVMSHVYWARRIYETLKRLIPSTSRRWAAGLTLAALYLLMLSHGMGIWGESARRST
ncbi:MAG: hypothetical protein LAQ30_05390 [Acidobacteriia bacterium]|nr:hypothetical protein [Terriglobia bacterium]